MDVTKGVQGERWSGAYSPREDAVMNINLPQYSRTSISAISSLEKLHLQRLQVQDIDKCKNLGDVELIKKVQEFR